MDVNNFLTSRFSGFYKTRGSFSKKRCNDQKDLEQLRKDKRRATVNANRHLESVEAELLENVPPTLSKEDKRKLKLMKWKKQKEEILQKVKKETKKPFVVGVVRHKINSPFTDVSSTLRKTTSKQTKQEIKSAFEKRETRAESKKKTNCIKASSPLMTFNFNHPKPTGVFKFKAIYASSSKKLTKPISPAFMRREAAKKILLQQSLLSEKKNNEEKKSSSDEEYAVPLSPPVRVTRSRNQSKRVHVQVMHPQETEPAASKCLPLTKTSDKAVTAQAPLQNTRSRSRPKVGENAVQVSVSQQKIPETSTRKRVEKRLFNKRVATAPGIEDENVSCNNELTAPVIQDETMSAIKEESVVIENETVSANKEATISVLENETVSADNELTATFIQDETVSANKKLTVPVFQDENVSAIKEESVCVIEKETVLANKEESVCVIENETVSPNKEESVCVIENETVSATKEESVCVIENETMSANKEATISVIENETVSADNELTATFIQDEAVSANKEVTTPGIQDKTVSANKEITTPDKNDTDNKLSTPTNFMISPFVTVERGKKSGQRSSLVRASQRRKISLRDGPAQDEPADGPTFQKSRLNIETARLLTLAEDWEKTARLENLNQDTIDDIDLVVGQTRLLTRDKFKQFRNLIEQHEADIEKIKITLEDLNGFWEMMYLQVEDLNRKYSRLETLKLNNWTEPDPPVKRKPMRANRKKTVATKSSVRDFIKEKKKGPVNNLVLLTPDAKKRRSSTFINSPAAYNALRKSFTAKDFGKSPSVVVTHDIITTTPKSCLKIKPDEDLMNKSVRKTVLFSSTIEFKENVEAQDKTEKKATPRRSRKRNGSVSECVTPRRSARLSMKSPTSGKLNCSMSHCVTP